MDKPKFTTKELLVYLVIMIAILVVSSYIEDMRSQEGITGNVVEEKKDKGNKGKPFGQCFTQNGFEPIYVYSPRELCQHEKKGYICSAFLYDVECS